ncbi:translation initiation factor IF-3 [Rubrobacter marinus]|uniref:translation initiation factor IF-3 n=1 Tax=Rubrobacter marinus TaxID=2653852 RepID=UPI001409A4AD|nr:translation initiation factor IF-3 [Rubrobacter marinus]
MWKEWCTVAAEEEPRINGQIRARSVRLISEKGEQLGIRHIREAQEIAEKQDLDLVEVAANSDPPVVKIMDYGKDKYRKEQARKAARKKQVNINVREIKLRPKIGDHDFNTKRGHVERFLRGGDKVKVTIMFRGREVQHPDLGEKLLRRLATDLEDLGRIESQPNLDGRNMVMVMSPKKEVPPKAEAKADGGRGERQESQETSAARS